MAWHRETRENCIHFDSSGTLHDLTGTILIRSATETPARLNRVPSALLTVIRKLPVSSGLKRISLGCWHVVDRL